MQRTAVRELAPQTPPLKAESLTICVVDDDKSTIAMLKEMLKRFGFATVGISDPQEALEQIGAGKYRVVLCSSRMSDMDGLTFLEQALARDPGIYIIVMTGSYSIGSAIEAIKRGAYDYLPKPVEPLRLKKPLDDLAVQFQQQRRIRELEEKLLNDLKFHGIVGRSPAMLEVFDLVRKIARHYTNVLLTGQTGTGKELIANALHQMSPVSTRRFAVCNCSTMDETLLESQLFGHVRGAFSGAVDTRPGLFEYANGGTVFLDEVGDTSLAMQAKLLRVIQNREIQRVGSPEVRRVDIRLIAASKRDLAAEIVAGRFREDLLHRLNTMHIRVPSLGERLQDIPLLVSFFVKKYNQEYHKEIEGLTRRAQTALLQHEWPGNVRELENVISSAALAATNDFIDIDDLPGHLDQLDQATGRRKSGEAWRPAPLHEIRREHIRRVLEMCGGNRMRASQMLGIGRTSLYRYLRREGHINGPHGVHAS
jgi:DNA-binding NtrC family response regulator